MEQSDLLMRITEFIEHNGGSEKLAHDLEMEWLKHGIGGYHRWNREQIDFLINYYRDVPISDIMKTLNLNEGVVKWKIRTLKRNRILRLKRDN